MSVNTKRSHWLVYTLLFKNSALSICMQKLWMSSCRSVWGPCKRFLKYRTPETVHECASVTVRSKWKHMSVYPLFQGIPLHILTLYNLQNAKIHHRLRLCSPIMQTFQRLEYKLIFLSLNWTPSFQASVL